MADLVWCWTRPQGCKLFGRTYLLYMCTRTIDSESCQCKIHVSIFCETTRTYFDFLCLSQDCSYGWTIVLYFLWRIRSDDALLWLSFLIFAGKDEYGDEGILASTSTGVVTDDTWKCTANLEANWSTCAFNDSHWLNAHVYAANDGESWEMIDGILEFAEWIWAEGSTGGTVYCRKRLRECKLYMYSSAKVNWRPISVLRLACTTTHNVSIHLRQHFSTSNSYLHVDLLDVLMKSNIAVILFCSLSRNVLRVTRWHCEFGE